MTISAELYAHSLRESFSSLALNLLEVSDTASVGNLLADFCLHLFNPDSFLFTVRVPGTNLFRRVVAFDRLEDGTRVSVDTSTSPPQPYVSLTDLHEGRPILLDLSGRRMPTLGRLGSDRPSRTLLFAPVMVANALYAVISVQSYDESRYNSADLELLNAIAKFVAPVFRRVRAEKELEINRERFRRAIEQLDAVPYERDYDKNTLNYMGEGVRELTGYGPEEITISTWRSCIKEVVMRGEARDMEPREAGRQTRDGAIKNWRADYRILTRTGKTKWVADSAVQVRDIDGKIVGSLGILIDITDRMQTERLTSALSRLGLQLSSAQTPRDVAQVVLDVADELLGWDSAFFTIYSEQEKTAQNILHFDSWNGERKIVQSRFDKPETPTEVVARVIRDGALLINRQNDAEQVPPLVTIGNDRRSASLMFVPIRKRSGETLAAFSIQSYTPNKYDEESLKLLQSLAEHGSGALDRTFIEDNLQRVEEKARILADLAHRLNGVTTANEAGKIIAEAAKQLLGYDAFTIDLYKVSEDRFFDVLNIDTVDGEQREFPNDLRRSRMTPLGRRVLEEGAFLILRTAAEMDDSTDNGVIVRFGDKRRRSASMMFAPARMGNRTVGMISIHSYTLSAYDQKNLETLQALADHCGGALERIGVEAELQASEERYKLAAQGSNDGLWDWDLAKGLIYYSPRLREILGYESEFSDSPDEWFSRVHPQDMSVLRQELDDHLAGNTSHFQNEHRILRRDGSYCWVLCRGVAIRNKIGQAIRIAGSMTDIDKRRAAEEQLTQAAFYDQLTGLANRSLFMDRLEHCLGRAKRRSDYQFAVLFIDIDRFKMVNDSLGHLTGDMLLQELAKRLVRITREDDTVARLGGDEFTVILEDNVDANQAMRVADRILERFQEPFMISNHEIFTNASIGIALSSSGYGKVEEILRDADTALYRAKELGRGRYVMFDQRMHETIRSIVSTENGLRNALRNNEFVLHYQPIMNLTTNHISGFEALLRWNRPGVGLVSPAEFMGVAEDSGIIVQIGEWVMRAACRQMAEWTARHEEARSMFMSVNLSPRQFASPGLGQMVEDILQECALNPANLHVEITETAILNEPQNLRHIVDRWKELGIGLLLDDFGTGYSPLAHLISFPVNYIKVDRAFVNQMHEREECQNIVRAVVSLARIFNLSVIAEGAEMLEHIQGLRSLHCDYAQGYFISRPLPAHELEEQFLNSM